MAARPNPTPAVITGQSGLSEKLIITRWRSSSSKVMPSVTQATEMAAAGYAVAFGLPYDEALKGVTLYPAELWGVDKDLGSLDVGKTANVVVANGDPLDVKTDVKQVYIQGQPVPMVTKQTILRDQYQ